MKSYKIKRLQTEYSSLFSQLYHNAKDLKWSDMYLPSYPCHVKQGDKSAP